jgi:formylglycine-generating enzyme required for sulfatase activity
MTTLKGFICYARADHDVVKTFHDTHLAAIRHDFGIDFWRDLVGIAGGEDWNDAIAEAMASADVFLLLLSTPFCASDYIRNEELPRIRARRQRANGAVIPLLMSDCSFQPLVGSLQVVPHDNGNLKPIDKWQSPADGWLAAETAIRRVLKARFNLAPASFDWEEPTEAIKQTRNGPLWRVRQGYLDIDPTGHDSDRQGARHNDTAEWHRIAAAKAKTLAERVRPVGNQRLPGDYQLLHDIAPRFAAALSRDLGDVADDIRNVWELYNELALAYERHRKRAATAGNTESLLPDDAALDLGDSVAMAAPFLRQFVTVREIEDDRCGPATDAQVGETRRLLEHALEKGLIPESAAVHLMGKLNWRADGGAPGATAAAYAVGGARNLIVEMCGQLAADRLGRPAEPTADRAALLPRVRAVLTAVGNDAEHILRSLSYGERRAIEAAISAAGGGLTDVTATKGLEPQEADSATQLPSWASAQGPGWIEFTVPGTNVTQRMRLCPAGPATLGSSKDTDPDRFDWELDPHPVTFDHDFWMFETPCTQALWQAVMGDNPSHFHGSARPVERVSFEDAVRFTKTLNGLIDGLNLTLPTEDRWEYACRAGTMTPTYAKPNETLNDIAWYDGNSGDETHDVKGKKPNAWGLYDMLGNVLEWCDAAPGGGTAGRAIRGGSWSDDARGVRAAYRLDGAPSNRRDDLGFRCARVRNSDQRSVGGVAERADPGGAAKRGAPQAGGPPAPPPSRSGAGYRTRPRCPAGDPRAPMSQSPHNHPIPNRSPKCATPRKFGAKSTPIRTSSSPSPTASGKSPNSATASSNPAPSIPPCSKPRASG